MANTRRFVGWVRHRHGSARHVSPLRLVAAPPVGTMVDWYVTLDICHGIFLAVFDIPDQANLANWRSEADAKAFQEVIRLLGGREAGIQVGGRWEEAKNRPD